MDETPDNRLREARATFNPDEAAGAAASPRSVAAKVYRAKVFKSGNSLALRLPAALRLEAGMEMELLVDPAGGYTLTPSTPPRQKLDVGRFWGKAKGMIHVPQPRQDFDPRPSSLHSKP
jgi:antitoxin VapB